MKKVSTTVASITVLVLLVRPFFQDGFSQEERAKGENEKAEAVDAEYLTDVLSKGFKKAIEEVNMKRAMEKAKREDEVNSKLDSFIQQWINASTAKRKNEINRIIDQDWEGLPAAPPQHPDYYLRGFSYSAQDKNIIETGSITYLYQATVMVKELLFVERTPLIAEPRSDYEYTADTEIGIFLRFNKESDDWQITDIRNVTVDIRKGWPETAKQKISSYFIPAE